MKSKQSSTRRRWVAKRHRGADANFIYVHSCSSKIQHNCILHGFDEVRPVETRSIVPQSMLPKGSYGQLDSHKGGLRTLTSFCSMNKSIMLLLAECSDTYLTLCSRHDVFRRKVDGSEGGSGGPNLVLIPKSKYLKSEIHNWIFLLSS